MVDGLMMDFPLTLTHFLRRAKSFFGASTIVSRQVDKSLTRHTFAQFYERTAALARALEKLGVQPGERVATLCWNHTAHLECYFAIPCMGAVLHTLNLRLHGDDLAYIANHADDKVIIVDECLLPLLAQFRSKLTGLRHVIVVGKAPAGDLSYEELLGPVGEDFAWPDLDERSAAALCYTSGTTGHPKGVLYSHRSTVLHTLVVCGADCLGLRGQDTLLPVVPMFHVNAWGLPVAAIAQGTNIVFPGPHLQPQPLLELIQEEKVTVAAGVPTIWLGLLTELDQNPEKWDVRSIRYSVIGGAAVPPSMLTGFKERHGVEVLHAWGMTELSPVGSVARIKGNLKNCPPEEELSWRASQGFSVPFVEQRHADEEGKLLPWDGKALGELEVRGPWVAASYFGGEGADRFTADGWFKTGDVVTIDSEGYIRIADRSKDVIKSGGEWISSVALENCLMSHPCVCEAAVFAAYHPRWDERPLAAVVFKTGQEATPEELAAHLEPHFAKWWMPEDYLVLTEIPKGSTGKVHKLTLRQQYGQMLVKA